MSQTTTHINLDACETCGHRPPHTIEEHIGAVQKAISAAEDEGIIITVRRTREGVRYDYRASGASVVVPTAEFLAQHNIQTPSVPTNTNTQHKDQ